jgi:NADH dehydrogenase
MTEDVVVLGSGYAGAGAIRSLESALDGEATVTWISDRDYHLVLHESHRCIRDPAVADAISIPVEDIKSPETTFRHATVERVDTDDRLVELDDGDALDYDYLVVGLGTQTAFFGIEGLEEYAHTLKSKDDAVAIHDAVTNAAADATPEDPARIVIGGAGLSGIQTAGEVAELRDEDDLPLEIVLVEGLDEILPGNDPTLQDALRARLEARDVEILTGEFVGQVDEETVYVGETDELDYDVLVWTGGITGREAMRHTEIDKDERTHRVPAGQDFRTADDRIFALGDAALVDQPGTDPAPPTAQAAWQAAEVIGENVGRAIRGKTLTKWTFKDKGTVISVGESAVAHDIFFIPVVDTFGGLPAKLFKKAIAARWIADVDGIGRALKAWPDM